MITYELLETDLTLIKFDNSVATDKHAMEFSLIVYIELNMKKLLRRTTKANILES